MAEGAFVLMLALSRKLGPLNREMKAHGWVCPSSEWLGHDLAGKILGLVGVGRIGRNLARMAGSAPMGLFISVALSVLPEPSLAIVTWTPRPRLRQPRCP